MHRESMNRTAGSSTSITCISDPMSHRISSACSRRAGRPAGCPPAPDHSRSTQILGGRDVTTATPARPRRAELHLHGYTTSGSMSMWQFDGYAWVTLLSLGCCMLADARSTQASYLGSSRHAR